MNIDDVRRLVRSVLPEGAPPARRVEVPIVGVNLLARGRGPRAVWAYDPDNQVRFVKRERPAKAPPRRREWPARDRIPRVPRARRRRLGELLVASGRLTTNACDEALARQRQTGQRIGRVLIDLQLLTEADIAQALAHQLDLPFTDLARLPLDPGVAKLVPEHIAHRHQLIPIGLGDRVLTVAMADPLHVLALDDITLMTGLRVRPVVATPGGVADALDDTYGHLTLLDRVFSDLESDSFRAHIDPAPEPTEAPESRSPVARLVKLILAGASRRGASEIHLVVQPREFRVSYKINGELILEMTPPLKAQAAIFARIRALAGLSPGPSPRAVTGTIRLFVDQRSVLFTLTSVPTRTGERHLIKLHRPWLPTSATELGLSVEQVPALVDALHRKAGVVVVCGPPGSGKTTTLHALISMLSGSGVTAAVERVRERPLPNVLEIDGAPAPERTWLDAVENCFAAEPRFALVSDLSDPAVLASSLRFASGGRVVLGGLDSPDAASAVERLLQLGVGPRLLAHALTLVIGQRLEKRANGALEAVFELVDPKPLLH